jgi:quercetin dioxygenase-like cupin family protein
MYLDSVASIANTFEHIEQIITSIDFSKEKDVAISSSIVKFRGIRSGRNVQGIFRNIRYFRNQSGWKIFVWHNDKLSSALHCIDMADADSDFVLNERDEMNGSVYQERSASLPASPDMRATTVKFENGSHTKWHYHEGWQVLINDGGSGFVAELDSAVLDLSKGKRVFIPPFVWHRHGAKPGQSMTHKAITVGKTIWDFEGKIDKGKIPA